MREYRQLRTDPIGLYVIVVLFALVLILLKSENKKPERVDPADRAEQVVKPVAKRETNR